MTTEVRLRRANALAREYDALMGLSWVALGIGLILAAVTGLVPVMIALGAAFSAMAGPWYFKRYGMVKPTRQRSVAGIAGALVAVIVLVTGSVLDRYLATPVVLTLVAVAVCLGVGQWLLLRRTGLTIVHWITYAALLVASLVPSFGVDLGSSTLPYSLVISGLALIAVGVTDHRRLTQLMAPSPEGADRRTSVPGR